MVLTSNVFYNDYKDMQLPYYLGENSSVIRNADKVETYGAEIGATWQPRWDFELFGNVGLLKTKIKSSRAAAWKGMNWDARRLTPPTWAPNISS